MAHEKLQPEITGRKRVEDTLLYRLELERLIAEISASFINVSVDEIDGAITRALRLIGEFSGIDRSYLFQFQDGGKKMDNTYEWAAEGVEPQIEVLKGIIVDEELPWFAERIHRLETFQVPRVADLPPEAEAEKQHFEMQDIKSLVVVPMIYGGSLIGFIGFDSVKREKAWVEEDIRLLKIVGEILVNALERRRTEAALRLFSQALEEAADGVQIADLGGYILYSNQAVNKIYGFSPEEFRGKHVNELNEDPLFASRVIIPSIQKTGRWVGELMVKHRGGKIFPIWLSASLVRNSKGKPIAMVGIIRDITEQKRMEGEKNRLIKAIASSTEGISITDEEDRYIYVNPAHARIYGRSQEELLGKTWKDLTPPEMVSSAEKNTGETLHNRDVGFFRSEVPALRKDGTTIPTEVKAQGIWDEKGLYQGHICVVSDISERKRIEEALRVGEERYRSLFENSPISLWEEDRSEVKQYIERLLRRGVKDLRAYFEQHPGDVARCAGMVRVMDINNATLEVFQAESKEELMESLHNIFTEQSYRTFKEELIALGEGTILTEGEDIAKTLKGDEITVSLKWSVVPGHEESLSKVLVSIIDITERKRAEEAIKNYAKKLEESNRLKDLFIDIMGHDILNPLNIASCYTEALQEKEPDHQRITIFQNIMRNLVRTLEIIENATKLSKLESLERIQLESMDVKAVIERVIENLSPMIANAGMSVENNLAENMWVKANSILEEVFANLISNAVKYAAEGKRIIVDGEDRDDFWAVKVRDCGEGIHNAYKSGIFERFTRMEKKGVKGSGLGLAIAKKIVELHDGRIWVEDNPGGGSVFVVEIPKGLSSSSRSGSSGKMRGPLPGEVK